MVCPLFLFVLKGTSQFRSSSSSLLSSVSSKFIYCRFLSQHATELRAFKHATLSAFSSKVVYAFQAGKFLALEARATYVFSIFLPFCSKRIKTSCLRTTKIENVKRYEELWVKTNFLNVFVALYLADVKVRRTS